MRDENDAWVFGRMDIKEARHLCGACVSSYDLFLIGMDQINQAFGLVFGERLAACKKSLFEFAPKYKVALLSTEKDKIRTDSARTQNCCEDSVNRNRGVLPRHQRSVTQLQ